MGRKRSVQKIPKSVLLRCPHCSERTRAIVDIENCPQKYTCPKCSQEVRNPLTSCCVICAFSKKKCPRTLLMEAKARGLKIK